MEQFNFFVTAGLSIVYLLIIGLIVFVQVAANRIMKNISDFFDPREFPLKGPIFMLLLIYILVIAIVIDILIWTAVVMIAGIFTNFWEAFTFATDSFTTLGGEETIPPPWEYIGPVISVTGIVIIAFGGSCLYSILYKN